MPTWQELKRQQEEQLSNAVRALFGMSENTPVTAKIMDDGCTVTLHTSSLSKFEFGWSNTDPNDITISVTSGRITTDPYGIQLTPAVITFSAIEAARHVIRSMMMPRDEAAEGTENNGEEDNNENNN
nr:MAG TPA: hypothetical protein [Caudoviricetes sp.]